MYTVDLCSCTTDTTLRQVFRTAPQRLLSSDWSLGWWRCLWLHVRVAKILKTDSSAPARSVSFYFQWRALYTSAEARASSYFAGYEGSRAWKFCVYWHHVAIYSSDLLATIIGWRPRQLLGWHAPWSRHGQSSSPWTWILNMGNHNDEISFNKVQTRTGNYRQLCSLNH